MALEKNIQKIIMLRMEKGEREREREGGKQNVERKTTKKIKKNPKVTNG